MSAPPVIPQSLALLAQQEIIDGIRTGMQAKPIGYELLVFLLASFALGALLVLAKLYYSRERRPKPAPRHNHFAAAVDILDLTAQERADLARLVARARPAQPAALLLSPAGMAHALERGLSDGDDPELHARLQTLAHKLFTDSPLTASAG